MAVSYEDAERLLLEWTLGTPLRNHARAVEAVMRRAALRYGNGDADETVWAITGLLHDADYEQWPGEHPARVVAWFREHGEPAIAHAISAHSTHWGVSYDTPLDKALLACDELAGFVVACCLVRPGGIDGLKPSSVKKKLKDKSFAAKVDRAEINAGVTMLGATLDDHIQLVIDALTPLADALGIAGSGSNSPD
jgi:predicted hydrolase (HD superfamily)